MRAIKFAVPARSPASGPGLRIPGPSVLLQGTAANSRAAKGGSGDPAARVRASKPRDCTSFASAEVKLCSTCPA